jgi:tRNA pseudouridine55 synthase
MTSADIPEDGVLPFDKPVGPTSHDIVAAARRGLHTRRVGHTGTLDPFASGLMLLCIGRATRIAEYLSGTDKTYSATVRLGVATDTDDHTGTVTGSAESGHVDHTAVEAALDRLRGSIMQVPPAYSAKKLGGERAYSAARAGRLLTLQAVPVRVHELTIVAFEPPDLRLHVRCSTGTYIRAIARDIGADLGVGAHLIALRRTAVGNISVDSALQAGDLGSSAAVLQRLLSPARAIDVLRVMPLRDITADEVGSIRHGGAVPAPAELAGTVALVNNGELIAIAEAGGGAVRPRKVLA